MWLNWVTVTSTPDTEAARDPTDEYFNDRGIQVGRPFRAHRSTSLCFLIPCDIVRLTWVPITPVLTLTMTLTSPGLALVLSLTQASVEGEGEGGGSWTCGSPTQQ